MNIIITGAKGIIGRVLTQGLVRYQVTPADLPEVDVRDYDSLAKVVMGHDAIIHLAWNTTTENHSSTRKDPDNRLMFENVYKAALQNKVRRVIMASSVHVNKYLEWEGPGLISTDLNADPDSPYGEHKLEMEGLGQEYAKKGLEVICVRFGGVAPIEDPWDDIPLVGLTYPDCVDTIRHCLDAKKVPSNYAVFYAVSENKKRIHDYSNPFGWKPKQDAAEFYNL